MRVLSVQLENFASYKKLDFDFTDQGLTLIEGPNGSGKSTLCDVVPWILFGKTAKDGAVDEVLSWPGDKITRGLVMIESGGVQWYVERIRGPKPKDNDLYFIANCVDERAIRGKDIIDTQRLINSRLGMDYKTYLSGAYFHEFSQTAQFFNTDAKNRRQITERLVDLSLAVNLLTKTQVVVKHKDRNLTALMNELRDAEVKLDAVADSLQTALARSESWERSNKTIILYLNAKSDKFESTRQIDLNEARRSIQVYKDLMANIPDLDLNPKCPTCGQDTESPELHAARHQMAVNAKSELKIEALSEKIKEIKLRVNPYIVEYATNINPYTSEIEVLVAKNSTLLTTECELKETKTALFQEVEDLHILQDVIADYRSTTIKNAIQGLQDNTNKLLTDHFDAEIRVIFTAEDADNLDVGITKDGNACSFSQLSKGQRCLLKLAFGVSVMKAVANHKGLNVRQLFFDEALDGLNDANKTKAFRLLETVALDYESVFVVEHSEALKPLFLNSYTVELVNGASEIVQS